MGFLKDLVKNPLTYLNPGAGILTTFLGGQKAKQNAAIDGQLIDPGAPPGLLDPNDIGKPLQNGSPYAQMQRMRNIATARGQIDMNDARASGSAASARAMLANRGGLSAGASERIYRQAMSDRANSNQLVGRDLTAANLGTDIAEEGFRRSAYNDIRQQNQLMQGQIYGANKLANATLNASRPKGLLGLGFLGL